MGAIGTLVEQYRGAFRDEPKLRAYAIASFIDDLGLATSTWATGLLMTNLFTTQRERAGLMLPSLASFLLGTVVSGPLADWGARFSLARLARWRWRLVVWARVVQAGALVLLAVQLGTGAPTLASILPFSIVSAFMKTALRPTRAAFAVDLLAHERLELDADGRPKQDERGEPLRAKTYLLPMISLVGTLEATATLGGLVLGGEVMRVAGGRYGPLFVANGASYVLSAVVVLFFCRPWTAPADAASVGVRALFGEVEPEQRSLPHLKAWGAVRYFGASLRDGARFLVDRAQRPLLILLMGAFLVEIVSESYDGMMIVKQVLHGTDDEVRHAAIVWKIAGVLGVALLPALARRLGSIGRIFVVTMLVDGLVMAGAGRIAGAGVRGAILPFAFAMTADHTLTLASSSLTELAQNSASSAAMRGRIAATYAFAVIVGDMAVEALATPVSESMGIPAMLTRLGWLQVGIVLALAAWGGRRLWQFGIRSVE